MEVETFFDVWKKFQDFVGTVCNRDELGLIATQSRGYLVKKQRDVSKNYFHTINFNLKMTLDQVKFHYNFRCFCWPS